MRHNPSSRYTGLGFGILTSLVSLCVRDRFRLVAAHTRPCGSRASEWGGLEGKKRSSLLCPRENPKKAKRSEGFFFEKKKQKTFPCRFARFINHCAKRPKSCVLQSHRGVAPVAQSQVRLWARCDYGRFAQRPIQRAKRPGKVICFFFSKKKTLLCASFALRIWSSGASLVSRGAEGVDGRPSPTMTGIVVISGYQARRVFFEKKKQKTFIRWSPAKPRCIYSTHSFGRFAKQPIHRAKRPRKVFCFFFQKRRPFLPQALFTFQNKGTGPFKCPVMLLRQAADWKYCPSGMNIASVKATS